MSRVLIVDEDPFVARALAELLAEDGHACTMAATADEAMSRLADTQRRVDLLVTELQLSGGETTKDADGLDWLRRVRREHPDVVPLVVTGYGKIEDAVRAIKLGAADYLTKPVLDDELRTAVQRAGELHTLVGGMLSDAAASFGVADPWSPETLERELGTDFRVHEAIAALDTFGPLETPVLMVGEAGTGRGRLAEALHARSPRREKPCVLFTCRGDDNPRHLAELVGHAREVFPEEPKRRRGAVGEAFGGTLVVRELHHALPAMQAVLWELVDQGRTRAIGDSTPRDADVRLVFTIGDTSNELVESGELRSDLFHSITAARLELPALRTRPDDIAALSERYVNATSERHGRRRRLGEDALDVLRSYRWPANLDELRSACEYAVLRSSTRTIGVDDLPSSVTRSNFESGSPKVADRWQGQPLAEALLEPERNILKSALDANGWNRSETARRLEIDRTTLYKKIRKFRLDEPG